MLIFNPQYLCKGVLDFNVDVSNDYTVSAVISKKIS